MDKITIPEQKKLSKIDIYGEDYADIQAVGGILDRAKDKQVKMLMMFKEFLLNENASEYNQNYEDLKAMILKDIKIIESFLR